MHIPSKKSKLNAIQDWMQQALILSGQKTNIEEIERYVKPGVHINAAACLAIYQRSYYSRLTQCLQEQFKALSYALGKDLFIDFCKEYLKTYPSDSPTLSDLGSRFPRFLRETRPDLHEVEKEPWVDFMIDLAQFEWDLYVLFDAKGQEGFPYADQSVLDKNLSLQICFSLNTYNFPVSDFYRAVAQKEAPEIPNTEETFVAICRRDYLIRTFSLTAPQYFFLAQVKQKKEISDALNLTAENFGLNISRLKAAWMQWRIEWLKAGFFVKLDPPYLEV